MHHCTSVHGIISWISDTCLEIFKCTLKLISRVSDVFCVEEENEREREREREKEREKEGEVSGSSAASLPHITLTTTQLNYMPQLQSSYPSS